MTIENPLSPGPVSPEDTLHLPPDLSTLSTQPLSEVQLPPDKPRGFRAFVYEHTLLNGNTSWKPTFFNLEIPAELQEEARILAVSLPFRFNGRWFPALKNPHPLRHFDRDFPHILLEFDGPPSGTRGDEALRLSVHGGAAKAYPGKSIIWRLYMPGREKIVISGVGKTIEKPQAEMTAADISAILANKIAEKSNGRLDVNDAQMRAALQMITDRSRSLGERWNLLDERLKFQQHLVDNPHIIIALFRSMFDVSRTDVVRLIDNIESGKIYSWSSFLRQIDAIESIHIKNNAIVAILLFGGLNVPSSDTAKGLETLPPSMLISLPGLTFINTFMEEYKNRIMPLTKKIAQQQIAVAQTSMEYVVSYLEADEALWRAAQASLKSGKGVAIVQIKKRVKDVMKRLGDEIENQIDGTVVKSLSSGQTGSKKT